MAMSFSRPDPGNPAHVAEAEFSTSRRGFDQGEVRDFLQMVAAELSRLTERVRFLEREVDAAQTSPEVSARLDEETLTRLLGEETARVLTAARSGAAEIREKAEHAAAQLVGEASDEATRIRDEVEIEASRRRTDAAADAEAEVEMAKQQGREMVNEARAYRERVLSELSRRRELAREQIEQLVHGRDRLVTAFEQARIAAVDVMADLEPLGEPDEYVNLTPTTGPVPVMVARAETAGESLDAPPPVETSENEEAASTEPTSDDVEVLSGDVEVDSGDVEVLSGDVEVDSDDVEVLSGVVEVDSGDVEVLSGVVEVDSGDVEVDSGVVEVDSGDVEVDSGVVEVETAVEDATADPALDTADRADVVVDLFARLRSAADHDDDTDAADTSVTDSADPVGDEAGDTVTEDAPTAAEDAPTAADMTSADGVDDLDDGPFEQRDAQLTPLIVAAARKLKRVLADEQNDVLDALRTASSVSSVDELLPEPSEQSARYAESIGDDLLLAAQSGAAATDTDNVVTLKRASARACVDTAGTQLAERLIVPLRERLERAVSDADGDVEALTKSVRAVYREVKTRQIDDVLDDVFRSAHGAGFSAAVPDGVETVWLVDVRHPACPDCDDNSLSPPIEHGAAFPTGHVSTPAHPGCRCMLHICRR